MNTTAARSFIQLPRPARSVLRGGTSAGQDPASAHRRASLLERRIVFLAGPAGSVSRMATVRRARACLQGIGGWVAQAGLVTREALLDDGQWELIEPLLPAQRSGRRRPMRDYRQVVEGIIYRYRCGIASTVPTDS